MNEQHDVPPVIPRTDPASPIVSPAGAPENPPPAAIHRRVGRVERWIGNKGYGFVRDLGHAIDTAGTTGWTTDTLSGTEVFVHRSFLGGGRNAHLCAHEYVQYDVDPSEDRVNDRLNGCNVTGLDNGKLLCELTAGRRTRPPKGPQMPAYPFPPYHPGMYWAGMQPSVVSQNHEPHFSFARPSFAMPNAPRPPPAQPDYYMPTDRLPVPK